ncbi:MAG: choice-of-anchor B family protein [Saprospiraceae bacterium]|nr:choice-of-anchor B family protein [Saprospiraceae bacterium]
MKKTVLSFLLAFTSALASAQLNMTLLDQIDYTPNTNDIWGWVDPDDGKEYALVGLVTGLSIVDVSNPSNVVEVQFIPGASSTWRDIKTWGNFAYVTNESSGGVLVVNLSGAPNNITWTNWSPNIPGLGTLNKCHNLYIDEFGYCYLAGCNLNSGGILIADVFTTPGSPVYVGKGPAVYSHDAYALNNRMYGSEIYGGNMTIYDVTNKMNVTQLGQQQTPYAFTHNIWLSDDGDVAFTTDEKANAPVAAYDISNVNNIVELDQFRPLSTLGTGVIPHNVHVWNDWLIISYYTSGSIIADASRPENIIEVGNFDTFLGANSGYNGVWGAYPFLPSGNVLLTDIGNGLFVCGANYVRACWLEGKVTNAITGAAISGASVHIASTQANAGTSDLLGNYETGQAIPGVFDVTFTATGYFPKTVQATLENGVLTILNVALEPLVINPFPPFSYTAPTSGCAPLTIDFFENTGVVASWAWTFENGSPATSTEQNPSVNFTVPGTHSVNLQVVTQGGNTYSLAANDLVVIAPSPAAAFSGSVDSVTVTFTNGSTNYNNLQWDFGDGNTSTAANPQHDYHQAGTYTVTLTVFGDCGVDVFTQDVTIGPFVPVANFVANMVSGCAPLTVAFTDQSSNGPTDWAWSFPGGDPATSTEQSPTVTYNGSGSFDVQLTVTNAAGSNATLENSLITVGESPVAGFSPAVNGPQVQFTDSSTGSGAYSWDFGDGGTSTASNPMHTFAAPGTYTVVLTVNNNCGNSSYSEDITIADFLPIAAFNANITAGCAPLTVAYSDQSSGQPIAWTWAFPGGNPVTSFEQNPVVTYDISGTYSATLMVDNVWGSAGITQTDLITINTTPTADFNFGINGMEVSFTNNSDNADTYTWLFNDGSGNTSTELNPTYTFPGAGTYQVELYATNGCGTTTYTANVTISAISPIAAFTFNNAQGCAPFEVQFTDQSLGEPTGWAWSFPGGSPATSTEQNPTVTYDVPGTYSATLTATNSTGTSEATQTDIISVSPSPFAGFFLSVNELDATFFNISANATSYLWDFGDGSTSTAQEPFHSYAINGTYTVVLTASGDCGISTFEQEVVIAVDAPAANFSASETQGCAPFEVVFADQSAGMVTGWAWEFPGGTPATSTEQNPTVTYASPGIYGVVLTVTGPGGSNGFAQAGLVVVEDLPVAGGDFNSQAPLYANFTNTSIGATSYFWDFGDGNTSTEESPVHVYSDYGGYDVTMIVTNICGSDTLVFNIFLNTAVDEAGKFGYTLTAAPNPFSNQLWVDYELKNSFGKAKHRGQRRAGQDGRRGASAGGFRQG